MVREELRDRKIRVINIYPAATDTEIWNHVEGKWPREKMISATQVADAVAFALARPTDTLIENITLSSLVEICDDRVTWVSAYSLLAYGSVSRFRKSADTVSARSWDRSMVYIA